MQAIRFEPRHMCSDLVKVRLHDGADPEEFVANLEDISPSGACLLLEAALPDGASIEVISSTCRLKGKVRYCRFVEIGYVGGAVVTPLAASTFPRAENSSPRAAAEPAQYFKKCLLETVIGAP